MKRPYSYPYKPYEFKINLLQQMGLVITDEQMALNFLKIHSYQRIRHFSRIFEISYKKYQDNTSLEDVFEVILVDYELRKLLWDVLSRFELVFREVWAETMSKNHGVHAYRDATLFKNQGYYQKSISLLDDNLKNTKNSDLKSNLTKYRQETLPNSTIKDAFTFGQLSKLHANMKFSPTTQEIASFFNLPENILKNWLNHFVDLRNSITHHEILINIEFKNPLVPLEKNFDFEKNSRKIYNSLVALILIAPPIYKENFKEKLLPLVDFYRPEPLMQAMGFPPNWRDKPLWQNI